MLNIKEKHDGMQNNFGRYISNLHPEACGHFECNDNEISDICQQKLINFDISLDSDIFFHNI